MNKYARKNFNNTMTTFDWLYISAYFKLSSDQFLKTERVHNYLNYLVSVHSYDGLYGYVCASNYLPNLLVVSHWKDFNF